MIVGIFFTVKIHAIKIKKRCIFYVDAKDTPLWNIPLGHLHGGVSNWLDDTLDVIEAVSCKMLTFIPVSGNSDPYRIIRVGDG